MKTPCHSSGHRARSAFTLVEVALALGLVAFAMVGLLGAIPLAAENSRRSIAQTRAASLASTLFANFRAQPFNAVEYADAPSSTAGLGGTASGPTIDLNTALTPEPSADPNSTDNALVIYAYFDEVPTDALPGSDARRVHFLTYNPATRPGNTVTGPIYEIALRFNNNPPGTVAPYQKVYGSTVKYAQANGIDVMIFDAIFSPNGSGLADVAKRHPKDVYHFNSVISNRLD